MISRLAKFITGVSLLSILQFAQAGEGGHVQSFNDYDIHYSVFNTSFLSPEVASAYGITRSKEQALINIAVQKKLADKATKAVSAIVKGTVRDLVHTKPLEFREVREQNSVYYLSAMKIDHKQTVYFTIMVQPDPNISPYKVEFSKKLYVE